jgi:hypothetical protein
MSAYMTSKKVVKNKVRECEVMQNFVNHGRNFGLIISLMKNPWKVLSIRMS